ncbi:MAG: hypothetical protein HY509_06165 [Acidobacteria bacterium]|nr:hypothetical protein [Acidobacteriota bacterium]
MAIAHGQMTEGALERVMVDFVSRKHDVLLATTIIENGLDIPNVNTLIVNRADRFGLAQLYQLRGRVGRSRQRAYAYLLVPSFRALTAQARQRLRVLQEFTRLGSGFRIAAMDLEIRGAGNILGAQQHGHIAAVGFDTYVRLLETAVHELRGEEVRPEARTELNLRVDYALPEDYLPDPHQRLFLYKRISSARTGAEIEEIRRELEDGFGRIPPAGVILFELARLRVLAASIPVQTLEWSANSLRFRFGDLPAEARARLIGKISLRPDWRLTPQGVLAIPAPVAGMERIRRAESVLKDLL